MRQLTEMDRRAMAARGKSPLFVMRRSAGFATGQAFAEHVGVPYTTYSRHEREPLRIPTERLWEYADALGCTIDQLVGREPLAGTGDAPVQGFYDGLSSAGRARMESFMAYVLFCERAGADFVPDFMREEVR